MQKRNLRWLLVTATALFAGTFVKAQTSEYAQIIARFDQWKLQQYKKGSYASPKTCTLEIASADGYKGPDAGISSDISVYYSDINQDHHIDALITFNPYLCGGGNALMNAEEKILVLSRGSTYIIDETFFSRIEEKLEQGLAAYDRRFRRNFFCHLL